MKKERIVNISILLITALYTFFPFITLYKETAVLPMINQNTGEQTTIRQDHWFSAFENLKSGLGSNPAIMLVTFLEIFAGITIIYFIFDMFVRRKEKWAFFGVSTFLFLFIMVYAKTVFRCY